MNKYEKKAKDQLVKLYDHVQGPMPRTHWGDKDHFNLWDFVCFNDHGGALVQVATTYITQSGKTSR